MKQRLHNTVSEHMSLLDPDLSDTFNSVFCAYESYLTELSSSVLYEILVSRSAL